MATEAITRSPGLNNESTVVSNTPDTTDETKTNGTTDTDKTKTTKEEGAGKKRKKAPKESKPLSKRALIRRANKEQREQTSADTFWEEIITTEPLSLFTPSVDEGRRAYKCKVCSKIFEKKAVVRAHIDICHQDKRDFVCTVCFKRYSTRSHLRTHERTHTGEKPFQCTVCGERFTYNVLLTKHMKWHPEVKIEGVNVWSCDLCNEQFTVKPNLWRHTKTAHQDSLGNYPCGFCDALFKSKTGLLKHRATYHKSSKPFLCNICSMRFHTAVELEDHSGVHANYKKGDKCVLCPFCPEKYHNIPAMKNHIQSMHKEHAEPTTDQKKKQVLEAADTTEGGETIVATALLEHVSGDTMTLTGVDNNPSGMLVGTVSVDLKTTGPDIEFEDILNETQVINSLVPLKEEETGDATEVDKRKVIEIQPFETGVAPVKNPSSESKNNFLCKYCDRPFATEELVVEHFMKCKKHYRCYYCNTEFPSNMALNYHLQKTHAAEAQCTLCQKLFPSHDRLAEHQKEHPKLVCDICDKKFRNKTEERYHEYMHTVNSIFWCRLCKNLRHNQENHITFL